MTWNGAHLLPPCLDSLLAQTAAPRTEVVVVDNASTDGTPELLRERYPSVHVVRSGSNLGFAGGAALGALGATAPFLLYLNNDATLAPDATDRLLAEMASASDVGAVTARVLLAEPDASGARLVNSTGNVLSRDGAGTDRDFRVPEGAESSDPDVFGFCGGAALLRRSAVEEAGGWDADLFLYYEDTDLSWRLRAHGWRVRYAADAVAVHRHAATSDATSPLFRYHNTRNSLRVVTRHAPAAIVVRAHARQLLGLARALVRPGPRDPLTRARLRAWRDHLTTLPATLRERRRVWAGAVVPRAEVARVALG